MKTKFSLIFLTVALIFSVFTACKSDPAVQEEPPPPPVRTPTQTSTPAPVPNIPDPQVPLTLSLLQRIRDSFNITEEGIGRFQFILSGRIVLDREDSQRNDRFPLGSFPDLENEYIKVVITFNDQTDGQAINIISSGIRTTIYICFESDDNLWLSFTCVAGEADELFYLDYSPNALSNTDDKGNLFYGGESFKVYFEGRLPYLLINLSQRDIDTLQSRTVPGRRSY